MTLFLVVLVVLGAALIALASLGLLIWLACRHIQSCIAASALSKRLESKETVGFFHPYAHAGGGGERVLWCAIHSLQERHPGVVCVVYTGDVGVSKEEFLTLASDRFGVEVKADDVEFVHLKRRWWVEASTWRRLTLLGQSLGSMVLAWEALCSFRPDVFIDSMGYAFSFPLFRLVGGCRIGCYVHYPTISTDMLARVQSRSLGVCNDSLVARSAFLSMGKLVYYKLFAWLYGLVGSFAEVVMVNSSWTCGHIKAIWKMPTRTTIVYPPCDTRMLSSLPLERTKCEAESGQLVLSLAQFRPEKDHSLQLRSLAKFFEASPGRRQEGKGRFRLILAGGCRDEGDRQRVANLRTLASELNLKTPAETGDWDVDFRTNISGTEMKELLGRAVVGLHTMKEEHFGISVVEFMAAGAIPLAHKSGGPLMDIVVPYEGQRTGFLADDVESYAKALEEIASLDDAERSKIASAARQSVLHRFSQETFEDAISDRLIAPLRGKA